MCLFATIKVLLLKRHFVVAFFNIQNTYTNIKKNKQIVVVVIADQQNTQQKKKEKELKLKYRI